MFGAADEASLLNHPVRNYLPLLADALSLNPEIDHIRTSATTWARRSDATVFPAATWFSIYGAREQRNLAAMVDNPADLVQPRGESPSYSARRSTVIDKYRKGQDPSGQYNGHYDTGKISEIGK